MFVGLSVVGGVGHVVLAFGEVKIVCSDYLDNTCGCFICKMSSIHCQTAEWKSQKLDITGLVQKRRLELVNTLDLRLLHEINSPVDAVGKIFSNKYRIQNYASNIAEEWLDFSEIYYLYAVFMALVFGEGLKICPNCM